MNIREAQLADCGKLRSLILKAAEPHRYEDFTEEGWINFCKPNELNSIRNRLQNKEYLTLCYIENEEILGVITFYKFEKLDQLFIHPSARRRGIATSLWMAARNICEAEGRKPNYWLKSSPMAVPLYENFGFHLTGDQEIRFGITCYPMEFSYEG